MVLSGWKNSFFLKDDRYGISIDRQDVLPELHQGDRVEVAGTTGEGRFAPVVVSETVKITGHQEVPPSTRLFTADDLGGGRQDSQWVTVHGTVQSAATESQHGRDFLNLVIDLGDSNLITARMLNYTSSTARTLNGAVIKLRGVCGSAFNTRRQFVGPRLFVSSPADITVERAAPADLFAGDISPISTLGQFDVARSTSARVKIEGVITYVREGHGFYLQNGSQGIYVQTNELLKFNVGSTVQVVGYPKASSYSPELINAIVRSAPQLEQVKAAEVTAESLITTGDGFIYAPYDTLLVRLKGTLLNVIPGTKEDILLLQAGDNVLPVRVPLKGMKKKQLLRSGSELEITAICSAIADESHEASSVELLVRSSSDVRLLHAGPWWTATHLMWVVGVLCIVILVLLASVAFTRRQAKLRKLVTIDPLTGLLNRRGFLMYAERQWEAARCRDQLMLLCFVDLDRFKHINDTFGHQLGDQALQQVGELLRECFRKSDVIGRLGGDEFAIAAADSSNFDEASVRERLEQVLKSKNAVAGRQFSISLSMGVLTCDRALRQSSIEDLLARADKLMYQEKKNHHLVSAGSS